MRWQEFHDRERRQLALELCIEKLRRFEVDPSTAIERLRNAAEDDRDVLLEAAGLPREEDGASSDETNDPYEDPNRFDPQLRFIDRLLESAVTGGGPPALDQRDAELIDQERTLLNKPVVEAFEDLANRVPQLRGLESEVRSTGGLPTPTPHLDLQRRPPVPLVLRLLYKRAIKQGTQPSYPPKTAFVLALRDRLRPLVGGEAAPSTEPLGRTNAAWEIAWDHLSTVGGYPPVRAWDDPRPPTPPPGEMLRRMWRQYRRRGDSANRTSS
jgi:hypothetical protein